MPDHTEATMRPLLALCTAAALAGCTTMADQLGGTLAPPDGLGNVLVSVTVRTNDAATARAVLHWQKADSPLAGSLATHFATDSVFGEAGTSPVEGKLHLLRLPAGRYLLQSGFGEWADRRESWLYGLKQARIPLNKPFDVHAGQTVYLGEVRFNLDNLPDVTFGDARTRDLAHIRRVWHAAVPDNITFAPWQGTVPRGN